MSEAASTEPEGEFEDAVDLEARVAVLEEENRRLRAEHRRVLQAGYRRSALGFGAVAVLAVGGAVVFGAVRDVLLAIAAIAAFSGLLTYYLTPERFVPATVGEGVYDTVAATGRDLVESLGLYDEPQYVPTERGVRVFVPQHRDYVIPPSDALDDAFVVTEDERSRGIALHPTGRRLVEQFETMVDGSPEDSRVVDQLAETLVEQFELADSATVDSREPGRVTVAVSGSAYGNVDRFDHPIGSVLATGLASTLDVPVGLDVAAPDRDRVDALVTCRWDAESVDAGSYSRDR